MGDCEIEIAWAAGLFEGEGNIYSHNGRNWELNITSTDKDVIDKFHAIMGVGSRYSGTRPNRKTTYKWTTSRALEVKRILHLLMPHFGERRRAKAIEAVEGLAWSASNAKVFSLVDRKSIAVLNVRKDLEEDPT